MRRRAFLATMGVAAVAGPGAAMAQQEATSIVGFLGDATPEGFAPRVAGVRRGLAEAGFVEGRNLVIEFRWARGNYDLLPALVGELVSRRVAVIVTAGTEKVTRAAKAVTTTVPIVATVAGDPVKRGLVQSVKRPGGNLTVVSLFTFSDNPLVAKRVELLHELLPKATMLGWLVDTNILDYDDELRDLQRGAQAFGLNVTVAQVSRPSELETAFASAIREGANALLETGPVFYANRAQMLGFAAHAAMPVTYEWRAFVDEGGLMSYGTDLGEVFRQAGDYAGRILKGERVGDLPVVQQTKIELILNLKTARALGIAVPQMLWGRADEVIE